MLHPQLHAGCWYDGCHGDASGVISRVTAGLRMSHSHRWGPTGSMATFFYVRVSSWKREDGMDYWKYKTRAENVHGDVEILRRGWERAAVGCVCMCVCVSGAVCGIVAVFAPVIDHSPVTGSLFLSLLQLARKAWFMDSAACWAKLLTLPCWEIMRRRKQHTVLWCNPRIIHRHGEPQPFPTLGGYVHATSGFISHWLHLGQQEKSTGLRVL